MRYQCENPHGGGCNLLPNQAGDGFACSWGCGKRVDRETGRVSFSEPTGEDESPNSGSQRLPDGGETR